MTELTTRKPQAVLSTRRHWPLQAGQIVNGATVILVLLALTPIALIALSWTSDQSAVWQHLIDTQLVTLLRNTAVLVLGVGTGVTLLGVSLAWLTVIYEFPGRRFFDWALMLPMAMPAYVLAFVVLGMFDFTGPLQQTLHRLLGDQFHYFDVRHEMVVITVLTLAFYPYVYMLARSAFLNQGRDVIEAARVLGASRSRVFFKVALPMARPAIVAGVALALMETLADFGAVSVFNYDTFTTAIYKAWFGLFNLQAAAQLASLLLLMVALALMAEKRRRGERSYTQSARKLHQMRQNLRPSHAIAASVCCSLVLLLAFIGPVLQLLHWVIGEGLVALDSRFVALLWHTLALGSSAALLTVALALLLAFAKRRARPPRRAFFDLATLGYALPGSVLAVGIMLSFSYLDRLLIQPVGALLGITAPLLVGSVASLLTAYWIRFLSVAAGPVEASLQAIHASIPEAASSLGAGSGRLLRRIYLPMLRPGLITAMILVFVDVMKEMPATLLLRPAGWDTLAVRIYEMTSEGEWQRAALPALALIAVGLLPVMLAVRHTLRQPAASSTYAV